MLRGQFNARTASLEKFIRRLTVIETTDARGVATNLYAIFTSVDQP